MTKQQKKIFNEILTIDKKLNRGNSWHSINCMSGIHNTTGIDYNKPLIIYKSKKGEKFTANSIKKITGGVPAIVLMIVNKYNNDLCLYGVYHNGVNFNVSFLEDNRMKHDINYFWGVGDFEEHRKKHTIRYFVIAQEQEYTKLPTPTNEKIDPTQRYKKIEYQTTYTKNMTDKYISGFKATKTDGSNKVIKFSPAFRYGESNPYIFFDKSGYYRRYYTKKHKAEAEALKAKRDKEKANAANFEQIESEVNNAITKLKKSICAAVTVAENYNDLSSVRNEIYTLQSVLSSFENYECNKVNKQLKSVEQVNMTLNGIIERCQNSIDEIGGGK